MPKEKKSRKKIKKDKGKQLIEDLGSVELSKTEMAKIVGGVIKQSGHSVEKDNSGCDARYFCAEECVFPDPNHF
jgi:hypothetical protein